MSAWDEYVAWSLEPHETTQSLWQAFKQGWDSAQQLQQQPSLFDDVVSHARSSDPVTSHAAAADIKVRAGSQRAHLLEEYSRVDFGLTDEEAAQRAYPRISPRSCWWKRCSELREGGYISPTGDTRRGSAGSERIVCQITEKGIASLEGRL